MRITIDHAVSILRMLERGESYRQITTQLGISRGTVANIVHGRWRPSTAWESSVLKNKKCLSCGGELPCLPCARRSEKATRHNRRMDAKNTCSVDDLAPALFGEYKKRKDEIDRARAAGIQLILTGQR